MNAGDKYFEFTGITEDHINNIHLKDIKQYFKEALSQVHIGQMVLDNLDTASI